MLRDFVKQGMQKAPLEFLEKKDRKKPQKPETKTLA